MESIDILAIGAHPDDVELAASGTLLRQMALGHRVGLLDLTRGELGTRGTPEIRTTEAMASARFMGVAFREQLNLADGFFEMDKPSLLSVVRVIRTCTPAILLANAPSDRHPDHGRAAELVRRAVFLSGLRRVSTLGLDGMEQEPWRPRAVYQYIQDHHLDPDFVVDITSTLEAKLEAIRMFRSQFYDPGSTEPESPISSREFLDFVVARAREMGRPAGYEFAEGWIMARPAGVADLLGLD